MRKSKLRLLVLCVMLVLLAAGCKKKPAPVTPPPPASPPAPAATPKPTATITVSPTSIERGQSTTVEWSAENATTVSISPEIGSVQAKGSRSIRPQQSTTYRLTASGPGGTAEASARVTVTSAPEITATPPPHEEDLDAVIKREVKTIYFDYDKYDIRDDQKAAMQGNANFLRAHSNVNLQIEGNCDERGSEEYNLGLGDRRANAVKEALVNMGVSAGQLSTISYGKEKPVCSEQNESCWQRNRRGDFTRKR